MTDGLTTFITRAEFVSAAGDFRREFQIEQRLPSDTPFVYAEDSALAQLYVMATEDPDLGDGCEILGIAVTEEADEEPTTADPQSMPEEYRAGVVVLSQPHAPLTALVRYYGISIAKALDVLDDLIRSGLLTADRRVAMTRERWDARWIPTTVPVLTDPQEVDAELDRIDRAPAVDTPWTVPARAQGQAVERAYAVDWQDGIMYRRSIDRSTSPAIVSYEYAPAPDHYDPHNTEPSAEWIDINA